jgi:UDP-N-acetylmuramoylalanine--D-glutamate ligase
MHKDASSFKGKNALVLGLGRSGCAVSKRLCSLGAGVSISEQRQEIDLDSEKISELRQLGVKMEFGGHTLKFLRDADVLVLSPGVHLDIPLVEEAMRKKIEILSEIEFAYRVLTKPIIAMTGTNGKTTTTTLVGEMLKAGGKRVAVCGNIGDPISAVDDKDIDLIVAEISSYQLEAVKYFKPRISVILNITEDHLERHKTMVEYSRLKGRIFMNQDADDHFVYNIDDPLIVGLSKTCRAKKTPFSRIRELKGGFSVRGDELVVSFDGRAEKIIDRDEMFIKGEHNVENALAASAAANLAGVPIGTISKVLKTFRGVPHRIEYVATISGVHFYNDSKGTNADSTVVALKALRDRVILIAGGKDKGGDLTRLVDTAKSSVKDLILIGEAKDRFRENFAKSNFKKIHEAGSMEDAVAMAFKLGEAGDKVLLSPACASFDMFRDYEHRGDVFKECVNSLERARARQ